MDKKELVSNADETIKYRNRREKVKNIIIVFLLIMLILTFFSNTIMNYSLPEVSVSRMTRSSVSRKYPLDITVEAGKNFTVTAEENRDIKRVAVKKGQEVKEGQAIFYLAEMKDSSEVKELEDKIYSAKNDYEKAILKAGKDYYEEKTAISQAREKLNEAIRARDEAGSRPAAPDNSGLISSLNQKKNQLTEDIAALEEEKYISMSAESYSSVSEKSSAFEKASAEYDSAKKELEILDIKYTEAGGDDYIKTSEGRTIPDMETQLERLKEDKADSRTIEDKEKEIRRFREDIDELKKLKNSLETAQNTFNEKESARNTAESEFKEAVAALGNSLKNELSSVEAQLSQFGSSSSESTDSPVNYDEQVREAQYALDAAVHSLEVLIENDRISDAKEQVDIDAQKTEIEKLEEKLEELMEKQLSAEITSPVDGVIDEIKVGSGESFVAGDELMVISIADDGFTAEASVSAEQAKSLSKGKEAAIADSTTDVKVTVKSIAKDKNDSSKFKVVFNISGDTSAGQNIKIELGESASQFDKVVPRSAVKQDSSGKFVYAVRSKSSPLGNRYIVEKVAVTVVAEDDTQCAVTGDFGDFADYIITASSRPFSAGDQVRLAQE